MPRKQENLGPSEMIVRIEDGNVSCMGRSYAYTIAGSSTLNGFSLAMAGVPCFPGVTLKVTVEVVGIDESKLPRSNPFLSLAIPHEKAKLVEEKRQLAQARRIAKRITRQLGEKP